MRADYLFHQNGEASHDRGDMSLQCGRRVDALKLWLSWQARGDEGCERRIDELMGLAQKLRDLIEQREHFELVRAQEGPNVCFHHIPAELRELPPGPERQELLGRATILIREGLRREGSILMNYAPLDGVPVLRWVASNQLVEEAGLGRLLDAIERQAESADLSSLRSPGLA